MKILSLLVGACFLFTALVAESADFTQAIKMNENFSVKLPSNWQQIPKDVLEQYKTNISKDFPKNKIPDYSYAFQKKNQHGEYFIYPYILVRIIKTPMTDQDIEKFTKTKLSPKALNKGLPSVLAVTSFDNYVYDAGNQAIWLKAKMQVQGSNIISINALKRTKVSTIAISCYIREEDYKKTSRIFEDFVRLLKVDSSIAM